MKTIKELHPTALWNNFVNLSAIPRLSKKEAKATKFLKNFGESLHFETIVDEIGNVIIKKPAFKGMEDRVTIVLQGHMDMVPQKNADVDHDFEKDGIKMYIDGDWVKAQGTTLGADNGIGVAAAMTILESTDIPHPPIETLFTVDEETGMTGAKGLKSGLLSGKILFNLDSEDDSELTIGCAGGIDIISNGTYDQETAQGNLKGYKISIKGLAGGHSGIQIHLGRANANKLMNRLLFGTTHDYHIRIVSVAGGSLRNAIPRESFATIAVPDEHTKKFEKYFSNLSDVFKKEYSTTDPELSMTLEKIQNPKYIVDIDFQERILNAIYACPNGIYRLSPDMENLTQTSNNLACVLIQDGKYSIQCLARSAVETEKMDIAQTIQSTFTLANIETKLSGGYPGWIPKPDAPIVKLMNDIYFEMFDEHAKISAGHGGLECGIIGKNYPEMDMISFGPNITGPHSPDEQVQISSVPKFWSFLLEILKQI
ncbi:MAG: aminoacyl-histidine dipeptidase [Candidatus Neomarinimicrobiota bacterium]